MQKLTFGVTALAFSAFAIAPAMACSWDKTAGYSKPNMTVAEAPVVLKDGTEVAIATNDLSEEAISEAVLLPLNKPEASD